jgi:MFS family permease
MNPVERPASRRMKRESSSSLEAFEADAPTYQAATGYAWFVVIALMVLYIVSLIDRQVLTLLIEPIQRDLELSDTQVSLLIGFAFALMFTIAGLPIARLADRSNRRNIITIGLAFWSLATLACGMAQNFWQLFFARTGVGIGEAALSPSAYSMIADYFPPEELGRGMAVYTMGLYLGSGIAMLVGSTVVSLLIGTESVVVPLIGEVRPWQIVFLVVGAPGLLIALIFRLSVKEPARRELLSPRMPTQLHVPPEGLGVFLKTNLRTLSLVFMAFTFAGIASIGLLGWGPEFLRRTYDWPIAQAGYAYGVCLLVLGGTGAWIGGWLSDRLSKRGMIDAPVRLSFYAFLPIGPLIATMCFMPNGWGAVAFLGLATFAIATTQSLSPVIIQLITPNQYRAQVIAIYLFVANFIVIGIGPTAYAVVTDYVFEDKGALRYSIALVASVSMIFALLCITLALRPFRASHDRASARATL